MRILKIYLIKIFVDKININIKTMKENKMRAKVNRLTIILDDDEDLYNFLEILYYYKDYCFEHPEIQEYELDRIKIADNLINILKNN